MKGIHRFVCFYSRFMKFWNILIKKENKNGIRREIRVNIDFLFYERY